MKYTINSLFRSAIGLPISMALLLALSCQFAHAAAASQCGPVIDQAKLFFTFECINDSSVLITDKSANDWHYTLDSANDGVASNVLGTSYEIFGMAYRELPNEILIVLNSNMPITGNPSSGALNGTVAHGDLFIDLTDLGFELASLTNTLFAVRYSAANDSNAPTLGVYKNVSAKSVAGVNRGFASLTAYINKVNALGGTVTIGDLPANQNYYNPALNLNVINNGDYAGPISFLDAADLAVEGFAAPAEFTGTHTIAFKFNKDLIIDTCGVIGGDGSSCLDCSGVACGGTTVDQCGVCGGDNSTCLDCAGIPNGGAVVDQCGVCGGDNSTCLDCTGTPNGGAQIDSCGVCNGNGSSCLGCDGIPNSQKVFDLCGVCGGDNSSCMDCAGIPNGGTNIDACGVCNGQSNTCLDCAGVPNGGATVDACGSCGGTVTDPAQCILLQQCPSGVIDQCGVCDGNNDCLDCAGVPNGGTQLDCCGVCGGDGLSCPELCTFYDLTQIKKETRRALKSLFGSVRKYSSRELRCNSSKRKAARKRIQIARELLIVNNQILAEFVGDNLKVCNTEWCAKENFGNVLETLKTNTKRIYKLSKAAQRGAANSCGSIGNGGGSPSRNAFNRIGGSIGQVPDEICVN